MKLFLILAVVIIGLGGVFFATQSDTAKSSAPKLTIQTVKNDMSNGGQLIDVRTPAEYASGHIDGAINLSLQDIQVGALPSAAKDKPIYVYCHSGSRASQAAVILKAAGYQNITNLGAMTHVQSLGGTIKT